ncbi:MAG: MarR family transcriptional regulator [Bacteroidetes bacterium]|nr:MarR family transcriptional regulator [Bacteroidota bacterium]
MAKLVALFNKIITFESLKIEDAIKQSKFIGVEKKAIINIIYTANKIDEIFSKNLRKFGLSMQQYNTLRILNGRKYSYATCGEIKDVMLERSPDITRLCDKLLTKNLIFKTFNPQNKRKVFLSISPEGISLLKIIAPKMNESILGFSNLHKDELEQLSNLLDKVS